MKYLAVGVLAAAFCTVAPAAGQAAVIASTVSTANATPFTGDLAVLSDGFIPNLGDFYRTNTVSTDFASAPLLLDFTFAAPVLISDLLLSLDNNDDYSVEFFNGATSVGITTIGFGQGAVDNGMDVFASFAPVPNGGTQFAFTPLVATSARLTASNGDGAFGIGEVQFLSAVPEPTTWALMIGGTALLGGALRRRQAARPALA